jgi:hypothetical protein
MENQFAGARNLKNQKSVLQRFQEAKAMDALPDELLSLIIYYMPVRDALSAASVSPSLSVKTRTAVLFARKSQPTHYSLTPDLQASACCRIFPMCTNSSRFPARARQQRSIPGLFKVRGMLDAFTRGSVSCSHRGQGCALRELCRSHKARCFSDLRRRRWASMSSCACAHLLTRMAQC